MKSLKYFTDKIEKGSWYRQGGGINGVFIFAPILSMSHSIGKHDVFLIQDGSWNIDFFEKEQERVKANDFLRKYVKNPATLKKNREQWKKRLKIMMKLLDKIVALEDDKNLNKMLVEYNEICYKTWMPAIVVEYFDPWGDEYIKRYSSKYSLSAEEIAVLTSPEKLSYLQQEKADRLKIVKSGDMSRIKGHYNKYYWYQASWQHCPTITVKHFEELIKKDMENPSELGKEVEGFINGIRQNKIKRREIIKKHKIDRKTQRVFRLFRELSDFRDERKKETMCKVHSKLEQFIGKLAEMNGLSRDTMSHAYLPDIKSFRFSKDYVDLLKRREKEPYVMYFDEDDRLIWLYGEDAKKVHDALENKFLKSGEIKGMPAYNGKVKGNVTIVNKISEFGKMKEGDILVSIMTRPEMMPIMKRAKAIVTDEGGVTCHAAIISRELKIPCIVGTQTATSILKDGDIVEVDADEGVVRKVQ